MATAPLIAWPLAGGFPTLPEGEIHLWCAWLDDPALADDAAALLSPDEQARARSFVFAGNRRRFQAARAILRRLLGGYLDRDPAGLVFSYGSFGKPEISGSGLGFNVSHSDDCALYAFSRGRQLGIDVEAMRDLPDLALIEPQLFGSAELAAQQARPAAERKREFYRRWTHREAIGKGCGVGLFLDSGCRDAGLPAGWREEALEPAEGFVGHLAYDGPVPLLRRFRYTVQMGEVPEDTVFTSVPVPCLPHRHYCVPDVCSP